MLAEPIEVTMLVIHALEGLGVCYAIGGSLASAVHGVVRATMDAGLVAELHMEDVEPLAQTLGKAFYADQEMMRDAVCRHASSNLIHLGTMFKVDVFVAKSRPFDQSQLSRRQLHLLSEESNARAYVTTAEDVVLSKLEWYQMSGAAVRRALRAALSLPLRLYGEAELHTRALDLAERFSLPAAYDAHYLALADWLSAEFWTADQRLARAVQGKLLWVRAVEVTG